MINVFSKIVGGPPHTLVRMTAQVVMMVATGQCDNGTLRTMEEWEHRLEITSCPVDQKSKGMVRLYSVKSDIFQNAFFWYFFIRNDLSRVDLIIKMVLEFLSNL